MFAFTAAEALASNTCDQFTTAALRQQLVSGVFSLFMYCRDLLVMVASGSAHSVSQMPAATA